MDHIDNSSTLVHRANGTPSDDLMFAIDNFITACQHLILSPLVAMLVTALIFLFVFARKFSY
jgi:hypothetical protein